MPLVQHRIDRFGVACDQIRRSVAKPLFQHRARFLKDRYLMSARTREGGGELIHSGQVTLTCQDGEFDRVGHGSLHYAGDYDCNSSRPELHDNLPCHTLLGMTRLAEVHCTIPQLREYA